MSGRVEQRESSDSCIFNDEEKPWRMRRDSSRFDRKQMHKRERRRARKDPDCNPEYNKYEGYVY